MNSEAAVISAVCKNKDIATVLTDNVDEIFLSHRDVWEALKSYYLKFRAVPDISVLQERFKDFEPEPIKGETGYYLDNLKNEFLTSRIRDVLLRNGTSLKNNSAKRVLLDMQAELYGLSRLTGQVRDIDLTDFDLAEEHFEKIREFLVA